ncbi:MAG: ADP-glyceromanno-heptose 6-epimerase [Synergistetes bacterium]|nr:MAG: ADP-L-glycero-D-manno-heptose-6-epimerase [bacterium 42_11]MBC7332197.1 ADP-glyceromanno-heptose 6-epimerase [Synergistota bacterium]MDK2871231.1 ADP-L-glycero-D-manno-heptose 6-epimerase [bacterium]
MIVVTGGAGFVGSNLVKGLNEKGFDDILIVDSMSKPEKWKNLLGLEFGDYMEKDEFIERLERGEFGKSIEAIFHQGACTDTTCYDVKYLLENNYRYSVRLLNYAIDRRIPFIYASSAAVYGDGRKGFRESPECENPLNPYGFSKYLFDRYVRKVFQKGVFSQVTGLRYFNVYGPKESHKGKMSSVIYQFYRQLKESGVIRLFGESDGYEPGEQRRDFIYVKDVVKVNLFLFEREVGGIFNCGTGVSRSFNDVVKILIELNGSGRFEYIPFPKELKGKYQSFTEADLTLLREEAGYSEEFTTLESGIREYFDFLESL